MPIYKGKSTSALIKKGKRMARKTARITSESIAAMIARISAQSLTDDKVVYFPVSRGFIAELANESKLNSRGLQIRDIQYIATTPGTILIILKRIGDVTVLDYTTRLKYYTTERATDRVYYPTRPTALEFIWDEITDLARKVLGR